MQNQSVTVVITGIKMSVKLLLLSLISNDKRTDWSPVQSVNTQVITKLYKQELDLFINIMITGSIGLRKVLLPINHKNYIFREKKNCQGIKKKGKFVSID